MRPCLSLFLSHLEHGRVLAGHGVLLLLLHERHDAHLLSRGRAAASAAAAIGLLVCGRGGLAGRRLLAVLQPAEPSLLARLGSRVLESGWKLNGRPPMTSLLDCSGPQQ